MSISDHNPDAVAISHGNAFGMLTDCLKWLQQQDEATPYNIANLRSLRNLAAKKRLSSLEQTRVSHYFQWLLTADSICMCSCYSYSICIFFAAWRWLSFPRGMGLQGNVWVSKAGSGSPRTRVLIIRTNSLHRTARSWTWNKAVRISEVLLY